MRKSESCLAWKTWKFVVFCLFYVTVTLWFLATSFPVTTPATSGVTTGNQWKRSKGAFYNLNHRKLSYQKQTRTMSDTPLFGSFKDTNTKINDNRQNSSMKNALAMNGNKQEPLLCDMDMYIEVNNELCDDLITKLTNVSDTITREYRAILTEIKDSLYSENDSSVSKGVISRRTRHDTRCDISSLGENCKAIRRSYMYGKDNPRDEETGFPLAFAMKIHTNANQAHRLLRYIYRPHNVYCVHVDGKSSSELYNVFKSIANCLDNVIVITDRVDVIYSTIRQVQAELTCMKAMLKSNVLWKYYINLTGQEFMLKTNLELVMILKLLNGSNNIESYPIGVDKDRVMTKTVLVGKRAVRTLKEKEPFNRNITLKKGSAYGLFHREFVRFVTTDELAGELIDWLDDTYAPEETIWATLNALPNVPGGFQGDVTNDAGTFIARAVKWGTSEGESCYGKVVRYVCVYGVGDLPWLRQHRSIIANKLYESFEPETLDCLENWMYRAILSTDGVRSNFDVNVYKDVLHG